MYSLWNRIVPPLTDLLEGVPGGRHHYQSFSSPCPTTASLLNHGLQENIDSRLNFSNRIPRIQRGGSANHSVNRRTGKLVPSTDTALAPPRGSKSYKQANKEENRILPQRLTCSHCKGEERKQP